MFLQSYQPHELHFAYCYRGVFTFSFTQMLRTGAPTTVSFVLDHAHVALCADPAVSPADIAIELMNSAQEEIRGALIPARVERLWQPSLYIG